MLVFRRDAVIQLRSGIDIIVAPSSSQDALWEPIKHVTLSCSHDDQVTRWCSGSTTSKVVLSEAKQCSSGKKEVLEKAACLPVSKPLTSSNREKKCIHQTPKDASRPSLSQQKYTKHPIDQSPRIRLLKSQTVIPHLEECTDVVATTTISTTTTFHHAVTDTQWVTVTMTPVAKYFGGRGLRVYRGGYIVRRSWERDRGCWTGFDHGCFVDEELIRGGSGGVLFVRLCLCHPVVLDWMEDWRPEAGDLYMPLP